jgi:phosphoribosylpyrophosphate synthetase
MSDSQQPIVLHDPYTTHIANVFRHADMDTDKYPTITWDVYPDQMPKMIVKNQRQLAGRDVVLIASMCDCANGFRVAMMLRHLSECNPMSLTLIVTAYMYGTDDRSDRPGMVVTAKHAIGIIEDSMRKAHGMRQRVFVIEPHTLQLLSFYQGSMHRIDAMPTLLNTVLAQHKMSGHGGSLCVVMPDNGADKRYGSVVNEIAGLCKVVCNKTRQVDGTVTTTIAEDHRDVASPISGYVIIDDLIRSGLTLIKCYDALRLLVGPDARFYVAAVHADFVGDAIDAISRSGVDLFYITDSNRNASDRVANNSKFVVLPCAAAIDLAKL